MEICGCVLEGLYFMTDNHKWKLNQYVDLIYEQKDIRYKKIVISNCNKGNGICEVAACVCGQGLTEKNRNFCSSGQKT